MIKSISKEIENRTGINIFSCYQCGKCSAGCAFAQFMDVAPSQLMRLIQLDLRDKVLHSNTIWKCSACITCSTRCPREIDVLRVINTVRAIAYEENIFPQDKDIHLFDEIFLDNISKNDRLHEFSSVIDFNLKSGKYFKDISLFPVLVEKGKLSTGDKVNTKKIAKIVYNFNKESHSKT